MTGTIPGSQPSPRFDDHKNILYWFCGDAFDISWTLHLSDPDTQEPHEYGESDRLLISFFDAKKHEVHQWCEENIEDDTVTITITPAISAKFPAGLYTYCIKYIWMDEESGEERVQTLLDNQRVKVESCH